VVLDLLDRETLIWIEAKAVTDELRCRADVLYSVVGQRLFDAHWDETVNS
jgi:hypothetical protein